MPNTARDADLRAMMRDPRCTDASSPGSKGYRDEVSQAWAQRYQGAAPQDATGKLVRVSDYLRTVERRGEEKQGYVSDYDQIRHGKSSGGRPDGNHQRPSGGTPSQPGSPLERKSSSQPNANPTHIDSFFDRMADPLTALANRLNIQPSWVMGHGSVRHRKQLDGPRAFQYEQSVWYFRQER